MSFAITEGIAISVSSEFRPDRSSPAQGRYLFTYTVNVANGGDAPARLRSRHWIITDGSGRVEEVVGDGVVGKQPHLQPGESFSYTSFCVLGTPVGQMHGTYTMERDDGATFEAAIAPFALAMAAALN